MPLWRSMQVWGRQALLPSVIVFHKRSGDQERVIAVRVLHERERIVGTVTVASTSASALSYNVLHSQPSKGYQV